MDLRLRDLHPTDLDALREVRARASWSNEGDRPVLTKHPEYLDLTLDELTAGWTLVATDGDRPIGFATALPIDGRLELDALFVDPDWMRRGVARALVRAVREAAPGRGADRIEVTGNEHARDFYLAVGFVPIGEEMTPGGVAATRYRLGVDRSAPSGPGRG